MPEKPNWTDTFQSFDDLMRAFGNQLKNEKQNNQLRLVEVFYPGHKSDEEQKILGEKIKSLVLNSGYRGNGTLSIYENTLHINQVAGLWRIRLFKSNEPEPERRNDSRGYIATIIDALKSSFLNDKSDNINDRQWVKLLNEAFLDAAQQYRNHHKDNVGAVQIVVREHDLHQFMERVKLATTTGIGDQLKEFCVVCLGDSELYVCDDFTVAYQYAPPDQQNMPLTPPSDIEITLRAARVVPDGERQRPHHGSPVGATIPDKRGDVTPLPTTAQDVPHEDVTPLPVVQAGPVVTVRVLGTWVKGNLKYLADPFVFNLGLEENFSYKTLVEGKKFNSDLGRAASSEALLGFGMENNVLVLKPKKKERNGQLHDFYFIKGEGSFHLPLESPYELKEPIQIIVNGPKGPLANGQWPLVIEIAPCGAA